MSGRYLLDTNILIGLLENEPGLRDTVEGAPQVFIPAVAAGELYFGAAKSGRPESNRERIDRFLVGRRVLACDLGVASEYGRLRSFLRSRGKPLPENDVWIAAVALRHSLTLATRDHRFDEVPSLSTVEW